MLDAIRGRRGLPEAALAAGLVSLLILAITHASYFYDVAWHETPGLTRGIFGLPHPWTLSHFGLVGDLPIVGLLMATLVRRDTGRRVAERGLGMFTVYQRRGPTGALLLLGSLALMAFSVAFDSTWHQMTKPPDKTFTPPHLMLMAGSLLIQVSLVVLFYDLARGPALADQPSLRRRAHIGLLISLAWLTGAVATVFPFNIVRWSAQTNTIFLAADLSVGIAAAVRLWPGRFPVLPMVVVYAAFRALVCSTLLFLGFAGVPPSIWPVLIPTVVAELWLLLPFNRRRSIPTVAVTGLVFGLAWAVPGYRYLLAFSSADHNSLRVAVVGSAAGGLLGALIGIAIAYGIVSLAQSQKLPAGEVLVAT
jgi:hypothetical protein